MFSTHPKNPRNKIYWIISLLNGHKRQYNQKKYQDSRLLLHLLNRILLIKDYPPLNVCILDNIKKRNTFASFQISQQNSAWTLHNSSNLVKDFEFISILGYFFYGGHWVRWVQNECLQVGQRTSQCGNMDPIPAPIPIAEKRP